MYNTKQKNELINYLKNNATRQMSVNEILEAVCGVGKTGKSTVYRRLASMVKDGTLLRVYGEDSKSVFYQYVGRDTHCDEHFHLKCTGCGTLIHLDCGELEKIGMHIKKEHSFLIDTKKTIFYGLCKNCGRNI